MCKSVEFNLMVLAFAERVGAKDSVVSVGARPLLALVESSP